MAWFSGRLPQFSSLTDQISSFTKEVLTETTEEVEGKAVVVAETDVLFDAHSVVACVHRNPLCRPRCRAASGSKENPRD